ncbi:Glucosamine-6-phosphate deaminase [Streptococcus sp. DD10]|uniref:glucosamine-6-phosphate deaminase n=1 Tax=Streptococcus sp. DD10 TaxID=1777878 RepID=UPI000795B045|nr:glucosamine-6-phosphate deaminase [Streptococcus sp. DD10]KXT72376.1 Glucosamine-6-phosphate deaminase [Streptococcus sp. DD10]
MKIIQVATQVEGGKIAFEILKEKLEAGAKVLGLATGSSPIEFYRQVTASDLDFKELISVNLDEYVGLSADNNQSYHYFMKENLFHAKPFKVSYLPNGLAENPEEEVQRYNQILAEHPVDLQILGVGRNGHIGFNEPGTSFESETHLVDLQQSTIEANSRFFERIEDVPTQALSMGIKNILAAKTIVLFAYGKSKADAIKGMVEGPVTEDLPASSLQNHDDVIIIADKEALSGVEEQ